MTNGISHVADVMARIEGDLGDLSEACLSTLADEQVACLLTACTNLAARLTHATSRVAAEAHRRELGDKVGARHTANWWAHHSRLTKTEAARRLRLARALEDPFHHPVATALAEGSIHTDHAQVIIQALADLPHDLPQTTRAKARDHLLEIAGTFNPDELKQLARGLLHVVDPERGEAEDAKKLQDEEDEANASARITFNNDGHGKIHGRFTLPALHGELFRNHLLALADPRRTLPGDPTTNNQHTDGPSAGRGQPDNQHRGGRRDGPVITPERLGQALIEYLERFPTDHLPTHAGSSIAVMVTIDITHLLTDHGYATLANGERITAGQARRLACQAGIIPAVLDSNSETLDLGRTRRLFSTTQHRALALRDQGCTTIGCGMPASICHAHHNHPWSLGGRTDLANARLLCPHHHRLIHHPGYTHRIGADNKIRFRRIT